MNIHPAPRRPTFAIFDTHPVMRMGLAILLRKNFEEAEIVESNNIRDYDQNAGRPEPDLVIYVLHADFEEEGYPSISEIRRKYSGSQVIVYGPEIQPEVIIDYFKKGVNGYLSKYADISEMLICIRSVMGGKRYLGAEHMAVIFEYLIASHTPQRRWDLLTRRQKEVADYLVQGMSTSSIAEKTGLHLSTISTFKAAIFAKLGIDNVLALKEILGMNEN
ncbi:Transcriptional regulatory protein UhpA [Dyadobacter sp. CECT 9275]|uniref:Transcriptional regulatory protein UhpA n=1 Tax=Dyadobacter helix TaxID=2822344 RepID=A0A916N800_9BACT|nr:response regulator transcription factor [Dyadobacter sp. CECT 9275]CAG5011282.1 Transcriptional regulatory protein UhpA [Dyadobacter sp. CECT 9275]